METSSVENYKPVFGPDTISDTQIPSKNPPLHVPVSFSYENSGNCAQHFDYSMKETFIRLIRSPKCWTLECPDESTDDRFILPS